MKLTRSTYLSLPERFYERCQPEAFPDPQLVICNDELAAELGLAFADPAEAANILAGQQLLPGSEPIAQAYAGSQFGHFVPQLGDGRAHLLGEAKGFDIQLKGSGRSRFSRRGDGRSALGPTIREFLVSEGMHALGVPTTRALGIVTTGEGVHRQDGPEPGGIFARVAASHIRVGTFQYFASRADHEALTLLTDYTINRHYADILNDMGDGDLAERCLRLLKSFAERQGELVAKWYGLGFIHGVMNTDNCALAGITIDYGPCAFQDEFKFQKVFSSIDHHGRYSYSHQMSIVEWNIMRLADCLLPLIASDEKQAAKQAEELLAATFATFPAKLFEVFGRKLGLAELAAGDEQIIQDFLSYLEHKELDFTLSFYHLPELLAGESVHYPNDAKLTRFVDAWRARQPDAALLKAANSKLIPRNHQIQRVIDEANQGNYRPLHEMGQALKSPFAIAEEHEYLTHPPTVEQRVRQTFCGT